MMTKEQISSLVEQGKQQGLEIRVRDIAYIALTNYFNDDELAYATIFGKARLKAIRAYKSSPVIEFLKEEIGEVTTQETALTQEHEDISFEENKAYMLKLKADTEEAMEKGEIEKKDGLKILADISTKLNDKFQVSADDRSQIVIVHQKYDEEVCPYCNHEIARRVISKEEAMTMYNLADKNIENGIL